MSFWNVLKMSSHRSLQKVSNISDTLHILGLVLEGSAGDRTPSFDFPYLFEWLEFRGSPMELMMSQSEYCGDVWLLATIRSPGLPRCSGALSHLRQTYEPRLGLAPAVTLWKGKGTAKPRTERPKAGTRRRMQRPASEFAKGVHRRTCA